MKRLILLFVISCVLLFSSCNKEQKEVKVAKNIKNKATKKEKVFNTNCYITAEELKKAGFLRLDSFKFYMLKDKDGIDYLLNEGDLILAKFKDGKFVKSYKAPKGQGPGDMIVPKSIFVSEGKINVFDMQKGTLVVFDKELNYLEDIRLNSIENMELSPIKGGFIGIGLYENKYNFVVLDDKFKIKEKFVPLNKIPAGLSDYVFPMSLNKGCIIDENNVSRTFWHYINKECKIDIYDIQSKEKKLSLNWEQDRVVSKKDIIDMKNIYYFHYIQKAGKYYVVQTKLKKGPKSERDILIFDLKGKMIKKIKNFSYDFVRILNNKFLYFIDDDENLICLKLII